MIVDKRSHLPVYTFKGREAVEVFLQTGDGFHLPVGRYDLSDGIRVLVQEHTPAENHRLEAHRRYTAVQIVVAGAERILWAPLKKGVCTENYDGQQAICFLRRANRI